MQPPTLNNGMVCPASWEAVDELPDKICLICLNPPDGHFSESTVNALETPELTRERCAKVLDEMAEKAKHAGIGRDDTESVVVVLEIGAARIRALPEEKP